MSRFLSVATALPEHRLEASDAIHKLRRFWPELERLTETDAAVGTRYLVQPVEMLLRPRGLGERQSAYLEHATQLAAVASDRALRCAGMHAADVDLVITVSCTGYVVPSLDVHLAPLLGLRPDVLRLPVTELGCSGGAAAIAFAHRHLRAFPEQKVLVVAVEVPSLTFQAADASHDNLTAALVFGDGAGAALLDGAAGGPGLGLSRAGSYLVPGTAGLLGFDLREQGFHVVLDRRLPRIVERELGPALGRLLAGTDLSQLDFYVVHAAGPRIFEAIERALELPGGVLDLSRQVFASVGNTSSAAIFFALERLLDSPPTGTSNGVGIGLGPGVSIEAMELAWTPSEDVGDEASPLGEGAAVGGRLAEQALLVADAVGEDGRVQS